MGNPNKFTLAYSLKRWITYIMNMSVLFLMVEHQFTECWRDNVTYKEVLQQYVIYAKCRYHI